MLYLIPKLLSPLQLTLQGVEFLAEVLSVVLGFLPVMLQDVQQDLLGTRHWDLSWSLRNEEMPLPHCQHLPAHPSPADEQRADLNNCHHHHHWCLDTFKTYLDMALGTPLRVSLLGPDGYKAPCQPKPFCPMGYLQHALQLLQRCRQPLVLSPQFRHSIRVAPLLCLPLGHGRCLLPQKAALLLQAGDFALQLVHL